MFLRLDDFKYQEFNGVRELAEGAERYLRAHGTSQEKGTVAEYPNERTIRYYLSEGLLESPNEKRGVASVFGYSHLLSLVLIKKLQSEGLPISVIRILIRNKSDDELEKLINEEVRLFTSVKDLESYRSSSGHTDDDDVKVIKGTGEDLRLDSYDRSGSNATKYLNSLRTDRGGKTEREPPKISPPLFFQSAEGWTDSDTQALRSMAPDPPEEWRRHEILPGLELHVSSRFKMPEDTDLRKRLFLLIDAILSSVRRPEDK